VLAPDGLIVLSAVGASRLQAGVIRSSGELNASSLQAKGGRIVLEGDEISLSAGSRTLATGATGGGTVHVGGGWQGSGTMAQARRVTMAEGAQIDVSATVNGVGGEAVLWSDLNAADGMTGAYGGIKAQGGAQGGDGGRIETSGAQVEVAGLKADASAARGTGGTWLLDPYDYTINAAAASTIVSSLDGGTSVSITTANNTGPGAGASSTATGVITVSSAINKTAGGDATLTLSAANKIDVNADISTSSGNLNLVLNAGGGTGAIAGVVSLGGGSLTKQGAGTLVVTGANTYSGGTTISAGALQFSGASASAGTGAISVASGAKLQLAGGVTLANPLSLTGGTASNDWKTSLENVSGSNVLSGALTVTNMNNVFVTAGSTLDINGNVAVSYPGTSQNRWVFDVAGTASVNGIISGATGINKNGVGSLTLGGANTFTDNVSISNGTMRLGSSNVLSGSTIVSGPFGTASNVYLGSGSNATLDFNGNRFTNTLRLGNTGGASRPPTSMPAGDMAPSTTRSVLVPH
jgi:autotransporter-associated beta strand protein